MMAVKKLVFNQNLMKLAQVLLILMVNRYERG